MRELIHPTQLKGYKGVVVGAGASGLAAALLLRALGANVTLLDRKEPNAECRAEAGKAGVALAVGEHTPEQFAGADIVVLSPGVPPAKLAHVLAGVEERKILSELEFASWFSPEIGIAVTGTAGKTTTVSLIAHVLESAGKRVFAGGNLGTPLSRHLLEDAPADVIVLEVSSFQLLTARSFKPRVGVLLNISENHLDYHADMDEYVNAKLSMFGRMTERDLAVLPLDWKEELERRDFLRCRRVYFTPSGKFSSEKLPGAHNLANIEAAWQAVRPYGVDEAAFAKGLATFIPHPHRIEVVTEKRGVLFVNDSKSTTVASLTAALKAFDRPIRLLAGGVFKGGDLAGLAPVLREKVAEVGLFGASREVFEAAWKDVVPVTWSATLADAVDKLWAKARPGDVILLSPATASFDLYSDYKARGKDFRRIVEALA